MDDSVSTFGFKSAVFIVTSRDAKNVPNEFKDIILSYPSITQVMVDSYCEILWADNPGEYLGNHRTENYAAGLVDT